MTDKQLMLFLDSICDRLEKAIQRADKALGDKVQRDSIIPLDNETREPIREGAIDLGASALQPLRQLLEDLKHQSRRLDDYH